jgi:hypothetical protein
LNPLEVFPALRGPLEPCISGDIFPFVEAVNQLSMVEPDALANLLPLVDVVKVLQHGFEAQGHVGVLLDGTLLILIH